MKALAPLIAVQGCVEGPFLRFVLDLPEPIQRRLAGRPIERDGLRLDVGTQLLLKLEKLVGEPAITDLTIPQGRRAMDRQAQIVGGRQPVGDVVDRDLPGPAGRIPLRVYTPRGIRDTSAALIYFHGGAWIYGSLESHDAVCRFLAENARVRVIAVDYRLAPEHVFPAAIEDGLAAYDWVREHAADLQVDADRIAVGGDSAGGTLAAVVANERRGDRSPAFQVLIYPATLAKADTESMRLFNDGFYLTQAMMDLGADTYVPDASALDDPRVSPLLDDVAGVCPAYVATAGFDPLRDEGEAYAELLRAAGVVVELRRFDALIHSFANMVGAGRSGPAAMREVAAALAQGLAVRRART